MMMAGDASLDREPYLRLVLEAFEQGRLEPYEYTRRVMAIDAATSIEQLAAVVGHLPDGPAGDGPPPPVRSLDAVDLALLRTPRRNAPRGATARYVTLVVVFVMFAVILGVGIWLTSRVHPLSSTSSGTLVGWAAALVRAGR